MTRSVLLPGGREITFRGLDAQTQALEFVRVWNSHAIDRCQCSLVDEVTERPEKGAVHRPVSGLSYYSGKVSEVELENFKSTQSVI